MSVPIISLDKRSLRKFSVLLHKTIKRTNTDPTKQYVFYIPAKSLDALYKFERWMDQGSKYRELKKQRLYIAIGFKYSIFQKLSSILKREDDNEFRRILLRMIDMSDFSLKQFFSSDEYSKIIKDDHLGAILDLSIAKKSQDRNYSFFLDQYLKDRSKEKVDLFFVLDMPSDMGMKIIKYNTSQEEGSNEKKELKFGRYLIYKEFPEIWKVLKKRRDNLRSLNCFYSFYYITEEGYEKEGLESVDLDQNTLTYPYLFYSDFLEYLDEHSNSSISTDEIFQKIEE